MINDTLLEFHCEELQKMKVEENGVTVKLTRKMQVNLEQGNSTLLVKNMPSKLVKDSVRINVDNDNVAIRSFEMVNKNTNGDGGCNSQISKMKSEIADKEKEINDLEKKIKRQKSREKLYSKAIEEFDVFPFKNKNESPTIKEFKLSKPALDSVMSCLTLFGEKSAVPNKDESSKNDELEKKQKQLKKLKEELEKLEKKSQERGNLRILLKNDEKKNCEVSLIYRVIKNA